MKKTTHQNIKTLTGGALVMAITASVCAVAADATPAAAPPKPAPGTLNSFFNGKLPDAIGKSKISLNSRLRWEHADQSNAANGDSDAFTIRTRLGITTAPLYGFQGMLEAENVSSITDQDSYNAAGSNTGGAGKTIIADPPTTEINQAWLSYSYTNMFTVKGGRQRIVYDNARFVGDVAWRQNQQTFDAVSLVASPIKDLSFNYAYLWYVNRVFGDVSGLPTTSANHDFESDSHLINVSYSGCKYAKLTAYGYLLDLDLDNTTGARYNNSCATYGISLTGTAPVGEKVKLNYRGEYAHQTDYAESTLDYSADYYCIEVGADIKPVSFGGGYEVLGSDNGVGFKTPLATLHAFNGWADVFLGTPGMGLRDFYGFAQITIPKIDVPLRFVFHKFDSDEGSGDYGSEFDIVATKKFGKYWTAIAKYAHYDGDEAPYAFDVDKFWLEMNFVF